MIEILMLISSLDLGPSASNYWTPDTAATITISPTKRCDDGASPVRRDGSPNWACEIDGCGPLERVCWSERVDFCFDEAGEDTGECAWEKPSTCSGVWNCFKLWVNCDGQWGCEVGTPCTSGSCTPIPLFEPEPPSSAHACTDTCAETCPAPDSLSGPREADRVGDARL